MAFLTSVVFAFKMITDLVSCYFALGAGMVVKNLCFALHAIDTFVGSFFLLWHSMNLHVKLLCG